jgi:hypothetical protein
VSVLTITPPMQFLKFKLDLYFMSAKTGLEIFSNILKIKIQDNFDRSVLRQSNRQVRLNRNSAQNYPQVKIWLTLWTIVFEMLYKSKEEFVILLSIYHVTCHFTGPKKVHLDLSLWQTRGRKNLFECYWPPPPKARETMVWYIDPIGASTTVVKACNIS